MTMLDEPTTTTKNVNADIIATLREMADYLEQNPKFPQINSVPYLAGVCLEKEELQAAILSCRGPWKKEFNGSIFAARRAVGNGGLSIIIMRDQLCSARTVKKTIPATERLVIEAKPEREVEEVVYDCPDSILRPDHDALGGTRTFSTSRGGNCESVRCQFMAKHDAAGGCPYAPRR